MKRFSRTIIVLFFIFSLVSCSKQVVWPSSELGRIIPTMEGAKGEIHYNDPDSLYITLQKITKNQYDNYLNECKAKGFTIDVEQNSTSYTAYNADGYKLELNFYSDGDMWIRVKAPISMSDFHWPNTPISSLLPTPQSSFGKIEYSDNCFIAYVGNTTINDYNDYVELIITTGFTSNTNAGGNYYYANNNDGYRVTLKYEGFNTMFVRIDAPSAEDNNNEDETDNSSSEAPQSPNDTTNNPDNTTQGQKPEGGEKVKYIANTNPSSMKFHKPDCSSISKMSEKNKLEVVATREQMIADGYSPCGICNP